MDFFLDSSSSVVVNSVVSGGQSQNAGLQTGDVILSVDGIPFGDWYAPQIGQTHLFKIERKGEQLTLGIPAVSLLQVNYLSLGSAILILLTFWGVGTLLLWRRFQQLEIRLLFFLSQTIAISLLSPLAHPDPWSPPAWMLNISVASLFLTAPLIFHFAITFPVQLGAPHQRLWTLIPLYGFTPIALLTWLTGHQMAGQLSLAFLILVVTIAIVLMIYGYQYRATSDDRRRLRVVLFGTILAGAPSILFYLLPLVLQSPYQIPEWAAGLFLIIAPISYLYATMRHSLFGIDRLINHTLVYTIMSLGIFVLYMGPYLLLYRYFPSDLFLQLIMVSVLTLWVGWTFDWMRTRVQRWVDSLFFGGWYDYPGVVETISEALARSVEREQISYVLTRQVPELMKLRGGNLWIGEPNATFPSTPLKQERFRFKFQSEVPAQWSVGLHQDGDDLSQTDRRILSTLARQAEIALNNVLLIETLRRQLDEIRASREIATQAQRQLLRSREEERARLARDLHDSPIQTLVGLNIQLGLMLTTEATNPLVMDELNEMRAEVRTLLAELRQVCAELRPPMLDTLGLGAALSALAEDWSEQHEIPIHLNLPPDAALRPISGDVAVNLYRVVQEALTNVIRHAAAENVTISLIWEPPNLKLTVQDDGQGFIIPDTLYPSTVEGHFGLVGMRERVDLIGGQWKLESAPGQGTAVRIFWQQKELEQKISA
jgi:signal transduction histidine kinase